jgi:hypothetical protein
LPLIHKLKMHKEHYSIMTIHNLKTAVQPTSRSFAYQLYHEQWTLYRIIVVLWTNILTYLQRINVCYHAGLWMWCIWLCKTAVWSPYRPLYLPRRFPGWPLLFLLTRVLWFSSVSTLWLSFGRNCWSAVWCC